MKWRIKIYYSVNIIMDFTVVLNTNNNCLKTSKVTKKVLISIAVTYVCGVCFIKNN